MGLRQTPPPPTTPARPAPLTVYFGLWALMKAPLLLSADLPRLSAATIAIVNASGLIAVNQDRLGVQA